MQNNGWIKLHRQLWNNPIAKKPTYLSVWIYILLHANHEKKEIIWNNKKRKVEAGCFIGSIKKIAETYGLSTGTVSYVLDYLIAERMIEKKSSSKFTYFKVINWESYQGVESKVENKLKTNRKHTETNNNDKNDKNDKKVYIPTPGEIMKKFLEDKEYQKKVLQHLIDKGINPQHAETELKEFISYWSEPTKSGKKQNWETKKTFELSRRLATWFKNAKNWSKKSNILNVDELCKHK